MHPQLGLSRAVICLSRADAKADAREFIASGMMSPCWKVDQLHSSENELHERADAQLARCDLSHEMMTPDDLISRAKADLSERSA